jgi:hypothetical protein
MKNQTLESKLGLRNKIDPFTKREAAFRWAANCYKQHIVILGDKCTFWVVCFADAQKLVKLGYEIAA